MGARMKQESEEAALALSPFAEMGRGAPTIHAEGDEPARLVAVLLTGGAAQPRVCSQEGGSPAVAVSTHSRRHVNETSPAAWVDTCIRYALHKLEESSQHACEISKINQLLWQMKGNHTHRGTGHGFAHVSVSTSEDVASEAGVAAAEPGAGRAAWWLARSTSRPGPRAGPRRPSRPVSRRHRGGAEHRLWRGSAAPWPRVFCVLQDSAGLPAHRPSPGKPRDGY